MSDATVLAPLGTRMSQRHAAIRFVTARTPTEAARALLANPLVTYQGDVVFLGSVIARTVPLSPEGRERLISIAATVLPGAGGRA